MVACPCYQSAREVEMDLWDSLARLYGKIQVNEIFGL